MRPWRLVGSVALVAALAACGLRGTDAGDASSYPTPTAPLATPAPAPSAGPLPDDPALADYYAQRIEWSACGSALQCANLRVPLNYAAPASGDIRLALVRRPAENPAKRVGSLVVEPGGPGVSGVEFVRASRGTVNTAAREVMDVVGFDPRGVGKSEPVECLNDAQTDEFIAADPPGPSVPEADPVTSGSPGSGAAPDTPSDPVSGGPAFGSAASPAATPAPSDPRYDDGQGLLETSREFGTSCAARTPRIVPFMATVDVARDLDILRAALAEEKLNYLGYSYGTLIGATYAEYFPARVGRMVLDGAMDPSLDATQISQQQSVSFQTAFERFVLSCTAGPDCPLGTDPTVGMARLQNFIAGLDANPLRTDDPDRPLTQSLAVNALAGSMYRPQSGWPLLESGLAAALGGDGEPMLQIADAFIERGPDGEYLSNSQAAMYAVTCLDDTERPDAARAEELAAAWTPQSPIMGPLLAWSMLPCHTWPVAAVGGPSQISAAGAPPILVVGTEFDPATPYSWAVALASGLQSGVLLTWAGGDGHLAYNRGSDCVDRVVNGLLVDGRPPAGDTVCTAS